MWKMFWEKKDTEGRNLALVIFWILVKMCHWHWHWKICGKENKSSMTKTEICWRENKSLMTKGKICLLRHWHTTSAPLAFLLTPLASAAVVNVKFYCKHNFPKSKYLQFLFLPKTTKMIFVMKYPLPDPLSRARSGSFISISPIAATCPAGQLWVRIAVF